MGVKSWSTPMIPTVSSAAGADLPLTFHDRLTGTKRPVEATGKAGMYVCGITPYDATHLGHAATYVTFDLAHRVLLDMGLDVHYVQNVTDIDDPLLERAQRDGVDWRELATSEISLFHGDMEALNVIPPQDYVGVVESMDVHIAGVSTLLRKGAAYRVDVPEDEAGRAGAQDVYLDIAQQESFGAESGWTREQMLEVFADRGGDPDRAGKRDALDPLLWRAERPGEPAWDGGETLGRGRPGWHIECTSIALDKLGMGFTVQGGGNDLIFPHHEMSAVQAAALTDETPFAHHYVHQGMVGYEGEKMSKSKGNLVKVSVLRREGVDPMAIRLVLLDQHYRTDWEYTDALLAAATSRLASWRDAITQGRGPADETIAAIRTALRDDLNSPAALQAVDAWANDTSAPVDFESAQQMKDALAALLGVNL